jgi:glycosyltransferase involved in cell wall biosynthesis
MISVIIPTYNDEQTLTFALKSILSQTVSDWECVVVDDGSDIPASQIVAGVSDSRMSVVTHPRNLGRGAARVTGLQNTTGDLIAWQDADDFSHPERLQQQLEVLRANADLDFVGTSVFATDGTRCLGVLRFEEIEPRLLKRHESPPVAHPTLMFRRSVLQEVSYRSDIHTSEDRDFLSRTLRTHQFANIARPLYAYRYPGTLTLRKYWESRRVRTAVDFADAKGPGITVWPRVIGHFARFAAMTTAHALGLGNSLALRSYARPTESDVGDFDALREAISTNLSGEGR